LVNPYLLIHQLSIDDMLFRCIDKPGLLLKSMEEELTSAQHDYARNDDDWKSKDHKSFLEVIKTVKPHVLIGTSTKPGAFTKQICQEMAKHVERPIIFPLSNPTRLHEAKPADIFEWTQGKALVATGSPFAPVEYNGKKYDVAECNNSVCFPGIGLGVILSEAHLLSPPLLVAATEAIAEEAPILKDPTKGLCPDIDHARQVSVKIAAAVIKAAIKENLNQAKGIPEDDQELEKWIAEQMWSPDYRDLEPEEHK
jgi:malate dehydrogenase (oxaloacetate-decarboxylating)